MKDIYSEIKISQKGFNIRKLINSENIASLVEFVSQDCTAELILNKKPSYILECLAPMLLSQKPAELLNIGLSKVAWNELRVRLIQIPDIDLIEVREINQLRQVLFYNTNLLERLIFNSISQEFLQYINYPQLSSVDDYLLHLIEKIRFHTFPHEIGLFLGYPLKDILGFMELVPLSYVKTQGWRVYGDERLSDAYYEKYQFARQLMNKAIEV